MTWLITFGCRIVLLSSWTSSMLFYILGHILDVSSPFFINNSASSSSWWPSLVETPSIRCSFIKLTSLIKLASLRKVAFSYCCILVVDLVNLMIGGVDLSSKLFVLGWLKLLLGLICALKLLSSSTLFLWSSSELQNFCMTSYSSETMFGSSRAKSEAHFVPCEDPW